MAKNMFLKETDLADEFLSASDIPKISELLKSAGFADHSDSWWELKNRTRNYAQKHYQTASKIPGSGPNDWNSRTVRYELGLMALHFLEVYGVKYWGAPTRRELEYPRDKVRIAQILRQVFYRQNRNGESNARAKHRPQKTIETAFSGQESIVHGSYPPSGQHPHPNPTVFNMGGLPVQSVQWMPINFSIGLHGNGTWQDVTNKSRDSPRNHPQEYPTPLTQMGLQSSQPGLRADPAGFIRGLSPDNSNPARTAMPRGCKESNTGQGDEMYARRQGSNRKRLASQQLEAPDTALKSQRCEIMSDDSRIIVISDEDSDAPFASTSKNRHQGSPVTTEATIKVADAFISRLSTPASGPPDDGVLDAQVLEDGCDGPRVSSANEESSKAADKKSSHPNPGLGASDHVHNQVTNGLNRLDGSRVEEQNPPSLPSPSASATTTREHSGNASKPEVQIQFFIITARNPRLAYTRWPEGTLRDKTLDAIFDEVATYTSKKTIRQIWFRLDTSEAEIGYPVRRGDEKTFDDMNREFDEGIELDRNKSNTIFKIWLEPDPAGR